MSLHSCLSLGAIQWGKPKIHIPIVEERRTVSMFNPGVNDPVHSTSIEPSRPYLQKIADVHNERILRCRNWDPFFRWGIENLEARSPGLLEEKCNASKIGVCSSYMARNVNIILNGERYIRGVVKVED